MAKEYDEKDLILLFASKLVMLSERTGGPGAVTFANFIGAVSGSYDEFGVDLNLTFSPSLIEMWCGFSGNDVPEWCVSDCFGASRKKGATIRSVVDSALVEFRKRGLSVNEALNMLRGHGLDRGAR